MTDPMRSLVMRHATATDLRAAAIKEGMVTMYEDGMRKALEGSRRSRKCFACRARTSVARGLACPIPRHFSTAPHLCAAFRHRAWMSAALRRVPEFYPRAQDPQDRRSRLRALSAPHRRRANPHDAPLQLRGATAAQATRIDRRGDTQAALESIGGRNQHQRPMGRLGRFRGDDQAGGRHQAGCKLRWRRHP